MAKDTKLAVLSIDGLSNDILSSLIQEDVMPEFAKLIEKVGYPRSLLSTQPPISCVAWASFATGCNPGKHGIYGFVDRKPGSHAIYFPNAHNLHQPALWEILSREGKRVFVMNLPCTYPPCRVNGVLIGGFLAPSLTKAVYPRNLSRDLENRGYRIDADPELGHTSKKRLVQELNKVLDSRWDAAKYYWHSEEWNYFHVHIMGTDRINHFLLRQYREEDKLADDYRAFYRNVDHVVGEFANTVGDQSALLVLSDHGFCPIRSEVSLSRYLCDTGWTIPHSSGINALRYDPEHSQAISFTPGRVYLNIKGREIGGCVSPDDYENIREQISKSLKCLTDENGNAVIRKVLLREELYWAKDAWETESSSPFVHQRPYICAPDLLAIPKDGYDLKAGMGDRSIFRRTALEGMHTYNGAICLSRGLNLPKGKLRIDLLAGIIMQHFGISPTEQMECIHTEEINCGKDTYEYGQA